ncbi:hypothetical protein [Brachyspira hampsonii]|nr:hypothetical protein [Brachyspira hampsonii]MBW5390837.1 hypothetical protein [Brachyspira hampsonii]MBW5393538.1 hypothetical protein [Brachyspira hampsonii]OEJ12997.1 hypothetical protein A9495_01375 [Brachyspira hampsonii]PTY39526.1 hypothetical protein DQ06_02575 [Brachyspira hampsonii bv. II]
MKKIALLLLILIALASCKTGTMIIMPVQNVQMPAYPPQSYLGEKSKYKFSSNYNLNNSLGMNSYLFNNTNTNNLFRKNFVYLK